MRKAKYTPIREPLELRALRAWYAIKRGRYIKRLSDAISRYQQRRKDRKQRRISERIERDSQIKRTILSQLQREVGK